MKRLLLLGVLLLAVAVSSRAMAADAFGAWTNGLPTGWVESPACDPYVDFNCTPSKAMMALKSGANGPCDPYVNYKCLDAYLGDDPAVRFFRYYQLEWGKGVAPSDPSAPPSRRSDAAWPPTPQSSPPMPFTEWPYGGTQNIGVTRPNSVDSPLMVAIANTGLGKTMSDAHVQVYGWINGGGNISTNSVRPGGNAPAAYDYTPNTFQLDQAVVYIERLADTVQLDHFDWGFRLSALYGENYRYTTAYGLFSYQLLNHNLVYGFDFPMVYTDLYFPVFQGMDVRLGRFISIPDIEAQLAPNNYTYVHSLTYTFDNYTNTGIQIATALTKNWIIQTGVTVGSDTMPWNIGQNMTNLMPGNALYPGATFPKDPGAVPSVTLGFRWTSDDGRDDLNVVADAINAGQWGYNNLQWIGATYYHKLNDYWHLAFETYNLHENGVPNANNPRCRSDRCRRRHTVQPANHSVQCPGYRAVQQRGSADLHGLGADVPDLSQLFAEQAEQLFHASRILRRHGRAADRHQDALSRRCRKLATLAFAANRDAPGNRLLQVARCSGVQRQRQCGNRFRTRAMRWSAPPT